VRDSTTETRHNFFFENPTSLRGNNFPFVEGDEETKQPPLVLSEEPDVGDLVEEAES
jgi:hypothetical protein